MKKIVLFVSGMFMIAILLIIWNNVGKKDPEKISYITIKTGAKDSFSEEDIDVARIETDQEAEESLSYAQYIYQQRKQGISKSATVMREKVAMDDNDPAVVAEDFYQETFYGGHEDTTSEINGENEEFEVSGIVFAFAEDLGAVDTNGSGLNMRAIPSESGRLIRKIDDGEEVSVTGVSEEWLEIEYDGELGYIKREFLLMDVEEQ